jgi:hypothetical protein
MVTKSTSYVRGRTMRVTRSDACGRVVYGEDSSVVTGGFVSVAYTANTTESEEISVTNAAGDICVFEPSEVKVSGYSVEVVFCDVDPDVFTLITGQESYLDAFGNVVGFTVDTSISLDGSGFGLEVWMGAANVDACAVGGTGKYGYLLLPYLKGGILGDFTVENGGINFTITGASTRDGNAWAKGPYNVQLTNLSVPGPLVTALTATQHLLLIQTEVAPPTPAIGARPVMDPAATAITSVTTSKAGLVVTFTFVGGTATPVYIDFGDGTWDWAPSAVPTIAHTYAANGTYTAKATTNGVVRTVVVTLP